MLGVDNIARYTQIFKKIFPKVFFQLNFSPRISRIFGWKVHIPEIQQFLVLPENFPGNFCTICCCFQILESFGWMESAVTMSTDIHWATERLTDSRVSYRSVFNLPYFEYEFPLFVAHTICRWKRKFLFNLRRDFTYNIHRHQILPDNSSSLGLVEKWRNCYHHIFHWMIWKDTER